MRFTPKVIAVAGAPGSGKDELIRAVKDLGTNHAEIVPKHTSRARRPDDGGEMICPADSGWNLENCDVKYDNYGDSYGIELARIWEGLARGSFQVIVVSNVEALNQLRSAFGALMKLVFVHSEVDAETYVREAGGGSDYVEKRVARYSEALETYIRNIEQFDHVLLHAGPREDLYDQIFRLFRSYERGDSG
jgi:guanylate kinase